MAKAKFDIKTEATRPLYAGVGATDIVVGAVRDYFAEIQTTVADIDLEPRALREQAKARRLAVEARVAELQAEVRGLVDDSVDTAASFYDGLVQRGETLVTRIRRQESTKATAKSAKTTSVKVKTTTTQGKKTAKQTSTTAKRAAKRATTTAKKSPASSSAKATVTAAKNTASAASKATTDAAAKVGD